MGKVIGNFDPNEEISLSGPYNRRVTSDQEIECPMDSYIRVFEAKFINSLICDLATQFTVLKPFCQLSYLKVFGEDVLSNLLAVLADLFETGAAIADGSALEELIELRDAVLEMIAQGGA
ncbi:hypothetical protein SNEBB_001497 [Seison nebaliae]|nr:hypothetical protein SNEBB_001497 [Seison nebaliae]